MAPGDTPSCQPHIQWRACLDGLHGGDGLHSAGSPQEVPDHGLGGVDAHVVPRDGRPEGSVLGHVPRQRRRRVRVHVVHVSWRQVGLAHRPATPSSSARCSPGRRHACSCASMQTVVPAAAGAARLLHMSLGFRRPPAALHGCRASCRLHRCWLAAHGSSRAPARQADAGSRETPAGLRVTSGCYCSTGPADAPLDAEPDAGAVRQGFGHVVRVAGEATPLELCQDGRPSCLGMLQLLEHQGACTAGQVVSSAVEAF